MEANNEHLILYSNEKFESILKGKTIVRVRRLSKDEMLFMGWYKNPLVIMLDDETQIILQSDDEGNDGGAGFIYNAETNVSETIYTI